VAQLDRLGEDGPWLAVTGICKSGAGANGGDLYLSADLAAWERVLVVPEGFSDAINSGNGVQALVVEGGRAHVAVTSGTTEQWFSSVDGRDWRKTARRNVPRAPQALARTLGVDTIYGVHDAPEVTLAWTSDGLFRKGRDAGVWARIFPR
jgi:hypothetical protein